MSDPRPRQGEGVGRGISPPTVTPVLVAELLVEGERMPVYVHVIDHPDARVLVDTGMTELHPAVADLDPRLLCPLSEQSFDLAGIDIVVNTHLHFDHCGGNHLFAGRSIYVQRPVKKSAAIRAGQCAWRNVRQVIGRSRLGGMPSACRMLAIVDRATRWPTFFSAP